MINIAYVIDTLETPNAGTEQQLLMLIDNLDKRRFNPHLIVLRNSKWLEDTNLPFPVYNVNLKSLVSLRLLKCLILFRRYCKKHNINIVQTFFSDGNVFGNVAAYFSPAKIAISSRKNVGYWHNIYWLCALRFLKNITTCYIANSITTAEFTTKTENVNRDNIHVIYNGLYLDRFNQVILTERQSCRKSLGIKPNHILIGTIANLRPVKNLTLFLRVAKVMHRKYPNTRYIIVGDGPERSALEKMIGELYLKGIVILAGEQDNVLPILAAMDIGVSCSKSESLSNAILEYMAAGLPCVVSEVGGNCEAIGYQYGLTFKNDDATDFSEKLERFIVDMKLREEVGRHAKAYAFTKYNHGQFVKAHEEIYETHYFRRVVKFRCRKSYELKGAER